MIKVFYSYSHQDETDRNELEKWLKQLRTDKRISEWHDRKIVPGSNLNEAIDENLEKSDLFILLISQDFLASDACRKEMDYAIKNRDRKWFVSIILKDCTWLDTDLKDYLSLPTDGKPISHWSPKESGWKSVYTGLKQIIDDLEKNFSPKIDFKKKFKKLNL